ncbi:putative defense protein Hdd11-like isoform X2 [Pomacea canaliculata]|uniref:putative defense protein Hdd11-like isoform X2 n=1 Tax=Pomacea canaliculata TaxID=400727 RepID=UPI000D72D0FB|nr:putative defense protein Hdd11-like isoform X2 [Pomacea canaliculata]
MTALKTLRLLGVAIVILAQVRTGFAYSSGAPASACSDMTPRHGGTKPTTPAPFRVTVTPGIFRPGDVLDVTISSSDSRMFKGFLLEARSANNPSSTELIGTFSNETSKYKQPCGVGSLTHSRPDDAAVKIFKWTAPSTVQGNVKFRLTVVEYFSAIYTNIESSTIVASTANTIAPSTTPTNTPVSTTATTTTRATSSTTAATTLSTTLTLSTRLSTTLMLSTKSSSAATTTTAQTTLTTRGVTPVTKGRQSLNNALAGDHNMAVGRHDVTTTTMCWLITAMCSTVVCRLF